MAGFDSTHVRPGGPGVVGLTASLSGTTLSVLGEHRGLQVVDVADADRPRWLARVASEGDPLALFPLGKLVVVASRDVWVREVCPACPTGTRARASSRLTVVDLSDPAAPRVRSSRDVTGKIVGGVLLDGHLAVLSNGAVQSEVGDLALEVYDLSSPDQLPVVGSARFRGRVHGTALLAAGRRLVVANRREGPLATSTSTTVTVLDVDPAGPVTVHSTTIIPGEVRHATYLGLEDAGRVLAIVSVETDGQGQSSSKLRTFGLKPDGVAAPLAEVLVPTAGAVAFGEARAVVAGTGLALIDLSAPATPVVREVRPHAGVAEDVRLLDGGFLVVGHERGPDGQQPALFAALYDLRDGLAVARGRVRPAIEGHNTLIYRSDGAPAVFLADDGRTLAFSFEAFRDGATVREAQLRVFAVDREDGGIDGLQIVVDGDDVTALLPLADGRLLAAGPRLMVVDARVAPGPRPPVRPAAVDLERGIFDIAVDGAYAYELVGIWHNGDSELHLVPAADPEIAVPLATAPAKVEGGRVLARAGRAYVMGTVWSGTDGGATRIDVHDRGTTGMDLRLRGSVTVPVILESPDSREPHAGIPAALVGDTTLVLRPGRSLCDSGPCPLGPVTLVDVADPDAPVVASEIPLPGAVWWSLVAISNRTLYLAHQSEPGYSALDRRSYITEVDASDPRRPVIAPAVPIEGLLVAVRPPYLFTVSNTEGACGLLLSTTVRVLRRDPDGKLRELAAVELPPVYGRPIVQDDALFVASRDALQAIDIRDAARPILAGRIPLLAGTPPDAAGPGLLLSRYASYRYDASLVPRFDRFIDNPYGTAVRVFPEAGHAYVTRWRKGVDVLPLGPAPAP